MTFIGALKKIVLAAPVGVLAISALPVFGAVGTITAAGVAVGSVVGALCAIADELRA